MYMQSTTVWSHRPTPPAAVSAKLHQPFAVCILLLLLLDVCRPSLQSLCSFFWNMKRRVDGLDGFSMGEDGHGVADQGGRGVPGTLPDALVPSWGGENAQGWRMGRGHGLGQHEYHDPFGFPFPVSRPAQIGSGHTWSSSGSTGSYFAPTFHNPPVNEMKPGLLWHASPYDDDVNHHHHHVHPHLKIDDFYHSAVGSRSMQLATPVHSAANYSCPETADLRGLRSLQLLPTNPVFPASSGDTHVNSFKDKDVEETISQELTTGFGVLQLILHKELTNSDVGKIGRIVLPKREAEAHLPPLFERDAMFLHMDDLTLPVAWRFKYRYWPNNKSRMYILENTGSFVKTHDLKAGDSFLIYKSQSSGNYVACGKKVIRPWNPMRVLHSDQDNTCNNNEDCNNVQAKKRNKLMEALLM